MFRSSIMLFSSRAILIFSAFMFLALNRTVAQDATSGPSPQYLLRQLTLKLTGQLPSDQEIKLVSGRSGIELGSQLYKIAKLRTSNENFKRKLHERINEHYRFRVLVNAPEWKLRFTQNTVYSWRDSDYIIDQVISQNRPWDDLILTKGFVVDRAKTDDRDLIDLTGFWSQRAKFSNLGLIEPVTAGSARDELDQLIAPAAFPSLKSDRFSVEPIPGLDSNTAGLLSSKTFFERYATSVTNANYGRAAAVFRIFLCDEMAPKVTASIEDSSQRLEDVFSSMQEAQGRSLSPGQPAHSGRHASDPSCQGCHYKLDPMAQSYVGQGTTPNRLPIKGRLIFRNSFGTKIEKSFSGLNGLAQTLVREPEYARCQVKRFWNWYVGNDITLSEQRLSELVKIFDGVGRKPKEFVPLLYVQPEFARGPSDVINFENVRPILKKCTDCHDANPKNKVPSLTVLPFGGSEASHFEVMTSISKEMDFQGDGSDATMPPKDETQWQLTENELNRLRMWFFDGGIDATGSATLPLPDGKRLSGLRSRIKIRHSKPSFDETYVRYIERFDLELMLRDRLGVKQFCEQSPNDPSALGYKMPFNGQPTSFKPGMAYLDKIQGCVKAFVNGNEFQPWALRQIDRLGLRKFLNLETISNREGRAGIRKVVANGVVNLLIGDGVLESAHQKRFVSQIETYLESRFSANSGDLASIVGMFESALEFVIPSREFLSI
jgi:hypothetical protein